MIETLNFRLLILSTPTRVNNYDQLVVSELDYLNMMDEQLWC